MWPFQVQVKKVMATSQLLFVLQIVFLSGYNKTFVGQNQTLLDSALYYATHLDKYKFRKLQMHIMMY